MVELLLRILIHFLPETLRLEGSVKASMGSVAALAATVFGWRLLMVTIPYRPNRIYYRLAIART